MRAGLVKLAVQKLLGIAEGDQVENIGPLSRDLFAKLQATDNDSEWPLTQHPVNHVKASSFADPADVSAFRRCKAKGKSDQECFAVGDNGIGKWGDDTTGPTPMCALPPEAWKQFGAGARGKKVLVVANGRSVVCELRDTMPAMSHISNGAGIDLNPAACSSLGLNPPIMVPATWQWV